MLNGSQGIGKSTLISKLGGEWFSDSLILSDTKETKTAAEKLQGYWILEIGEFAGLRKAEEETLRNELEQIRKQAAPLTEFDADIWGATVDHIKVYSKNDVRVIFRHEAIVKQNTDDTAVLR